MTQILNSSHHKTFNLTRQTTSYLSVLTSDSVWLDGAGPPHRVALKKVETHSLADARVQSNALSIYSLHLDWIQLQIKQKQYEQVS